MIIPTVTFCMLFVAFDSKNFHAGAGFFALGTTNIFVALSTTGVIFAYLGFRQALDYAGWIYVSWKGGYVLRVTPPAPHEWGFNVYDSARPRGEDQVVARAWLLAGGTLAALGGSKE